MKKDVFVNGHKRSDVVEDRKKFLNKMEDLKPYLVKFYENGIMKDKTYPPDCAIRDEDCRPVIIITYDEYTFLANDSICKAWIRVGDTFLYSKDRGQGIIVSEFLLPFGRLNIFSLSKEKYQEVMEKTGLTFWEAVKLFEYRKNNERY